LALLVLLGAGLAMSRIFLPAAEPDIIAVSASAPAQAQPPAESLQEQLLDPRLDIASRESMIEKVEMEKNRAEQQAAAEAAPAAPKTAPEFGGTALMASVAEVESGIFPGPEAMIRPSLMQVNNFWQGVIDGQVVMALAGAATDSAEGQVVIVTTSLDPAVGEIRFETYPAPDGSGALRVVAADDGVLTLETAQGAQLTFDLASRTFAQ
jgi:hypothetical protein